MNSFACCAGGQPDTAFADQRSQRNPIPRAPVPPTPQPRKSPIPAWRRHSKPEALKPSEFPPWGHDGSGHDDESKPEPLTKGKSLGQTLSAKSHGLREAVSAHGHNMLQSLRAGSRGLQSGSSKVQEGTTRTLGKLKDRAGVILLGDGTLPSIPETSAAGTLIRQSFNHES